MWLASWRLGFHAWIFVRSYSSAFHNTGFRVCWHVLSWDMRNAYCDKGRKCPSNVHWRTDYNLFGVGLVRRRVYETNVLKPVSTCQAFERIVKDIMQRAL